MSWQRNDAAVSDILAGYVNMTSDPTSMSASQISAVVDGLENVLSNVVNKPRQVRSAIRSYLISLARALEYHDIMSQQEIRARL